MNPRLVAISGPLEGGTFPLTGDVFRIGRHADNDLQVLEVEVSRHHCEIRREGERFTLRDLDSRQGTFVNTLPVRERVLGHSDHVQVGDAGLLFLLDTSSEVRTAPAVGDSTLMAGSTVLKRPGESFYLQPQKVRSRAADAGIAGAKIATDLNALLEISTAVQEVREVDPLADLLLELLMRALPAERGGVLLLEPGVEEPRSAAVRDHRPGGEVPFQYSRTVLSRVVEEEVGLLCEDLELADGLGEAESVRAAAIRSLLCAPLTGREQVLGALYFDASTSAFEEHHLELLTAAAGIASLALENARYVEWLRSENRRLQAEKLDHGMVGESPAMQRLFRLIERVAPADSTILIRGESGTGKELAARAVHRSSARAEGPFVAINCATLSETLLESELFGHERGAFTGAVTRKIGKLEAAHGGTLFLDEVGEIPLPLQAKLLRVLQEREFERVGGTRPIRVDVRVIAATNRDLEAAIRDGKFRDDLFYRLDVISFTLPPLRERRDDVPLLARHFARRHGERLRRRVAGLSPEARRALVAYDWPGNVRQLANVVERAMVLGQDDLIRPEDLPDEVLEGGGTVGSDYQAVLTATKRKLILDAFENAGGDYQTAAGILGIHVNSLHRLIRNLGLKPQLGKA